MIIACIILSSLSLLAATVNIVLFLAEKKHQEDRRRAMLDYIDNRSEGALDAAEDYFEEASKRFNTENIAFLQSFEQGIKERFETHQTEIEKLKSGVVPDYQTALAAANAVNDFNAGIVSIMNFDPVDAVRKRRQSVDVEGR